jgi:hypothetical protein
MEVHHHPNVEKKNFKEYFLEFLMIFLAVTMGFFAEQIREYFTDRHREKEYMESLVKDLQLDTAVLRSASDSKEQRYLSIDSALQYFSNHKTAIAIPLPVFVQIRRGQFDMFFIHHGGTIDQLKNSGSLRLIQKKELIDSIEAYYQLVQRSESRNTQYFDNQQASFSVFEKFIDGYDNIKYNQNYAFMWKPFPDSGSVSFKTVYLNEYINNLIRTRRITFSDRLQFSMPLEKSAGHLIGLIKKEYGLE